MNGPDERKVKSLGELPVAIEPPRDLWPGIEARLKAPVATVAAVSPRPAGARLAQLRWLAAAAMVASVAVGVWIGRALLPVAAPAAPTAQRDNGPGTAPWLNRPSALDAAYVSDPRYERQR